MLFYASTPNLQLGDLLSNRDRYLRWLDKSTHISNLKAVIAVQSFVLVMGTMVVTNSRSGSELLIAVLFVGYHVFCAFLSNFKYKLACALVAIPNLLLAALFLGVLVIDPTEDDPILFLWLIATTLLGIIAAVLSRVSAVPSQAERTVDLPKDDPQY